MENLRLPDSIFHQLLGTDPFLYLPSGGDKATWNSVGGSFVVGGQWLFANDHFALNVFGGPAYYSHSFDYEDGATEDDFSLKGSGGFSFRTGAMIGFAF